MTRDLKKALYESIIRKVAKTVKESIEDLEFNGKHLRYNSETGKYDNIDQDEVVDNDSTEVEEPVEDEPKSEPWENGDLGRYEWFIYDDDYTGSKYIWHNSMWRDLNNDFPYFDISNIIFKTNDLQEALDKIKNDPQIGNKMDNLKKYLTHPVNGYDDIFSLKSALRHDYLYYGCTNPYSGYVEIYTRENLEDDDCDVEDVNFGCNSKRKAIKRTFEYQDWELDRYGRKPTRYQGYMLRYWNQYFGFTVI